MDSAMSETMDKTNQYDLRHWYFDKKRRDLGKNPKGYVILHGNVYGRPGWPEGEPLHSSPITRVEVEDESLAAYTMNSIYRCRFEDCNTCRMDRSALAEWIPEPVGDFMGKLADFVRSKEERDKADMLSRLPEDKRYTRAFIINFSSVADYYFESMLLVHNGSVYYSTDYDVHVGMFQDSVLLGGHDMYMDDIWRKLDFRFFPFGGNRLEFYVWDRKRQPVYVYNSGHEAIEVDCPYGKFMVLSGETQLLSKENTSARIEESIAPSIDRHNLWETHVYANGVIGYSTPGIEEFMNPPEDADGETEKGSTASS